MTTPAPAADKPRRLRAVVASILCAGACLSACSPEDGKPASEASEAASVRATATGAAETAELDEAVAAFLVAEMNGGDPSSPGMFVTRTIDGGESHPRITLAYLTDRGRCGSGGCTLLVLEAKPGGAVELGRITLARPPIRVLTSRTNGMPDLGVLVCGGGIMDCHEAVLPFDGRRYASNPTLPPAYRPPSPSDGEVVISDEMVRLTFAGRP